MLALLQRVSVLKPQEVTTPDGFTYPSERSVNVNAPPQRPGQVDDVALEFVFTPLFAGGGFEFLCRHLGLSWSCRHVTALLWANGPTRGH